MAEPSATEVCSRCGAIIPRELSPCVWGNFVVCQRCHGRLASGEPWKGPAPTSGPPGYFALNIVARICMALGIAGGVVGAIAAIVVFTSAVVRGYALDGFGGAIAILLQSAFGALLVCGLGQLLLCVRDIALNTWHPPVPSSGGA